MVGGATVGGIAVRHALHDKAAALLRLDDAMKIPNKD
jgi:hypothetical protein